jgi:hypothetical protein
VIELLTEQSERIGGAALLTVPAFDSFVEILDNYSRLDLLVDLRSHLPPVLLNPVVGFLCLCVGLTLLYFSQARQLKRLAENRGTRLVDTSGVEIYAVEKPKLLLPVLIAFGIALLAAPILAVGYTLSYKGAPPNVPRLPSPPPFAYSPTPQPSLRRQPEMARTELNVQYGIGITGGNVNNPVVNNFAAPHRHLSEQQKSLLSAFADTLPNTKTQFCFEGVPDQEAQEYAYELQQIFEAHDKTAPLIQGLSWHPTIPVGTHVIIPNTDNDRLMSLASRIVKGLQESGIHVDEFAGSISKFPCDITVVVGTRPE